MPDVFAVLPGDLFRPLASPGASVYASILLQVLAETQRHPEPLSRELVRHVIRSILVERDNTLALTVDALAGETALADDEADAGARADDVTARSGAVLRYLERTGWLSGETRGDFSQHMVLPDYAFRLLRTLSEFVEAEPPPLAGLVFTIHSVLQEALQNDRADYGIPEAFRHTQNLISGLKELHHNIGLHINRVLPRSVSRDVLEHLLRDYQTDVVDRAYHHLRTTDHVSRYRPSILDAVEQLGAAERLEPAAMRQFERSEAASVELAAGQLNEQLAFIRDQFESLDRQLQAIDARHNQFVHAAVRAVEVNLAAHTTTSGQLASILKTVLASPSNRVFAEVEGALQLHRLELQGEAALAPARASGQPFAPDESDQAGPDSQDVQAARDAVLTQLSHAISPARVRRVAGDLLGRRAHLRAAEIPLLTPEDLPLLMYLRAYGDGTLGYRVEELEDWVQTDTFAFRDFRLHRVEEAT